jgi:hypothetical protein
MAYMRGDYYIWTDSSDLHVWSSGGYDGWDRSNWHKQEGGEARSSHKKSGQVVASGVCIPQEVADEYVMMRLAEMIKEGIVDDVIDRTIDVDGRSDNFGSRTLLQYADRLKEALQEVKAERQKV